MMACELRFLVVLIVNVVLLITYGCAPGRVSPPNAGRVDGWVAAMVGASTMTRTVIVPPKPEPKPDGKKCANCGGTGVLPGDGTVKPKCPECGGDGVVGKLAAKPAAKKLPAAKVNAQSGCTGGSCSGQRTLFRFRR